MAPKDMEKTSFITPWGTYYYKVMPFGLKNVGATYQQVATTLLHDLIHKEVAVYVDDMIVKSKDHEGHIPALRKTSIYFVPKRLLMLSHRTPPTLSLLGLRLFVGP